MPGGDMDIKLLLRQGIGPAHLTGRIPPHSTWDARSTILIVHGASFAQEKEGMLKIERPGGMNLMVRASDLRDWRKISK